MKDDKSMQWTIEPTLQEFMDRKMVIARATFARHFYFSRLYCRLTLRRLDADKTSDFAAACRPKQRQRRRVGPNAARKATMNFSVSKSSVVGLSSGVL